MVLAIAIAGCASRNDQRAAQAEASAAKAQAAAEHAEQSANQAQIAADKATAAADRATKAVQDATREINRVSDHIDQMIRDRDAREAAAHRRRLSHVTNAAKKAAADKAAMSGGLAGVAVALKR